VVPTAVPGRGGEGRAGNTIPGRFDVEEERGASMEAHTEHSVRGGGHAVEVDAEEERASTGVWWGNDRVRV
jgi:hypothetical protein